MTDTEATLIDRTGKSIGLKSISPIEHRFLTADLRMRDAIEETDVVIVFQPLTFDSGHSARVSGHPETRQSRLTRARQLEQPFSAKSNNTRFCVQVRVCTPNIAGLRTLASAGHEMK